MAFLAIHAHVQPDVYESMDPADSEQLAAAVQRQLETIHERDILLAQLASGRKVLAG